jgi:gluconate 2-dehydrogenase gamma chain
MTSRKMRRRRFLQAGATAAVAGTAVSCNTEKSPWRFLTMGEARTLEAVCEQIVPGDRDPGAVQAGVVHYIDRQLAGFHRPFRDAYRSGLAALDNASRAMHGAPFLGLPRDQQTAVLEAVEAGKAPMAAWNPADQRAFFEMMVAHTMQGFYGSPRHGGNREAASWRMLGVPDPPLRGRDQYDFTKKG